MYISCEEYYTKHLGDWCNNKCDKCFAEKDLYINTKELTLFGRNLKKFTIPKGTLWREVKWLEDKIYLINEKGKVWYFSLEEFKKCFEK